jgi:tRNA(Arg) A34 adenosine deaminase TadA
MLELLNLAGEIAIKRSDLRTFKLGAVGVRADGALVYARNESCEVPNRRAHAEYRLTKKLDCGAVVYVSRIKADGSFGLARPCPSCLKCMISKRVSKVHYSISNDEFGTIDLSKKYITDTHDFSMHYENMKTWNPEYYRVMV